MLHFGNSGAAAPVPKRSAPAPCPPTPALSAGRSSFWADRQEHVVATASAIAQSSHLLLLKTNALPLTPPSSYDAKTRHELRQ